MKHILGKNTKTKISDIDESSIQPNAVDLRLDRIFVIQPNLFTLSENDKIHRETLEMYPQTEYNMTDGNSIISGQWFWLPIGHYQILMKNKIIVGEKEAGWVVTRSTLIRNGIILSSGLYDSGYDGGMAALLTVNIGAAHIQRNARIGQYLCYDAESLYKYKGSYGRNKDIEW
jgi:deoxycytidine triphosphate deaminase